MPKKDERKTHCKHGHEYTTENSYIQNGIRQCRMCRRRRSSTWASQNKTLNAQKTVRWRQRHPDRVQASYRRINLRKKYGITPETYAQMLDSQNGACAICSGRCKTGKRLAVDHSHDTGLVRGLLCANCNRGIGMFADDPSLLQRASEYLARATFNERVKVCR